jgi:hypothetical protein
MPVIRQIEAGLGLNTSGPPAVHLDQGIAEGAAALGRGIQQIEEVGREHELRLAQQQMKVATFEADQAFNRLSTQFAGTFAEQQTNIAPNGVGFAETVGRTFNESYDEFLGHLPEPLRPQFIELVRGERERWLTQAAAVENDQRNAWYRDGVAETLDTKQAEVFEAPELFDVALADINRTIEASGLPPTEQEALKDAALKSLGQTVGERYVRDNPAALTPDALGLTAREGYYDAIRSAESGGNDQAANPRSSAFGRYQFTAGTWKGLVERYPGAGLTIDGRADPAQQEVAIRLFTAENERTLQAAGIPATDANLYSAHFLGADGAKRVLSGADGSLVSNYVPREVIDANPFLEGMTVARFKSWAERKTSGADSGAPKPSPEFAGLSFGERVELYDRAIASQAEQVKAAQATAKSQYDALKGSLELGIQTGEVASEQTILNSALTDGDKATLLRSYRAAQEEVAASDAFLRSWAEGTQPDLNPYNADDRKLATDAYNSLLESVPEDQRASASAQFIADTGIVPPPVVADVRQNLAAVDVNSVGQGLAQAAAIYDAAPMGLDSVEHGKQVAEAAATYKELVGSRGLSLEQAAQHVIDMRDPAKVRQAEVLDKAWNEAVKDERFTVGDVLSAFGDNALPGGPVAGMTPAQAAGLTADYLMAAERAFKGAANGDIDIARRIALEEMKRTYGVSTTSGTPVVMKFPPEHFYPAVDGSQEYIRALALKDAKDVVPDAANVMLVATPETSQDVRAGRPPRYNLMYQLPDGRWDMASGLFMVDTTSIEALNELASEERAIRFQMERDFQERINTRETGQTVFDLLGGGDPELQKQLLDIQLRRRALLGQNNHKGTTVLTEEQMDPRNAAMEAERKWLELNAGTFGMMGGP